MPSAEVVVQGMWALQHTQLSAQCGLLCWICWEAFLFVCLFSCWQENDSILILVPAVAMSVWEIWDLMSIDLVRWKGGQHCSKHEGRCAYVIARILLRSLRQYVIPQFFLWGWSGSWTWVALSLAVNTGYRQPQCSTFVSLKVFNLEKMIWLHCATLNNS